jgi:hypothetical protein
MAPLAGFLLFAGVSPFADYIFVLLLGQILWPLLVLRLDIQIQVELFKSRQDYYLSLSTYLLFILTIISCLPVLFIDYEGKLLMGCIMGCSLAAQALVRSIAIARSSGLILFECSNIAKNLAALLLAAFLPTSYLTDLFVYSNLAHGLIILLIVLRVLKVPLNIRILNSFSVGNRVAVRRARRVLSFSLPNSFIGMATARLPILAIDAVVAPMIAAAFLSATRLCLSPLNFILYAFRIIGLIEYNAKRKRQVNSFTALFITITALSPVILLPMLFPGFLEYFLKHLEPSWLDVLPFLPIIYPWAVAFLISGWLDRIFDASHRQHLIFRIEVLMFFVTLVLSLLIWAGIIQGNSVFWMVAALGTVHGLLWYVVFVKCEFLNARKIS